MARRPAGSGYPNVVDEPGLPRDPAWPTLEFRADPGWLGTAAIGFVGLILIATAIVVPVRAGGALTGGEVVGIVLAAVFGVGALWFAGHGLFTRIRLTLQPDRLVIERRRFATTTARFVVPRDHLREVALEESRDDGYTYRVTIRAKEGGVALVDASSSGDFRPQQRRVAAFLGIPASDTPIAI